MSRPLRILAWVAGALVLVLAVAAAAVALTFDPQVAIARLAAQVQRTTGRTLTVAGPVRLRAAWPPVLVAENVTLSNPPGASRPAMVQVPEVDAQVAFAPLFEGRVALTVTLVRPDVLLERGNWVFHPEPPPPASGPAGPSHAPLLRTELRRVAVVDGTIGFADASGTRAVQIPAGQVDMAGGGQTVSGRLVGPAGAADVTASIGPGLWPVRAHLTGSIDAGGAVQVTTLDLDAPAADQAGHLRGAATVHGLPVAVDLGVPAAGQVNPNGPLPFTLALAAAGASGTVQGSVAEPAQMRGLDATVSARIPDLAGLSPLAGRPLPKLGAVAFDARVRDVAAGLAMRSMRLTAPQGDLAGDVALGWSGRPSVRGTVTSTRLDIDALSAAFRQAEPQAAQPAPIQAAPAAPAPAPAAAPAPAPAPVPVRVIADRPLPLAPLRQMDADVTATLANVTAGGVALAGVNGRVVLAEGRLRVDPLSVLLSGGTVTGRLTADAAAAPPTVAVDLHAAGLRLDHEIEAVHGTADADIALQASGAGTRALAASLGGHANLVLIQGDIDNRLLAPLLEQPLRAAHIGMDLTGRSPLRCLVLQTTAASGVVTIGTLVLDAQRLRLDGAGTANLADETLALQLHPTVRVGGAAIGAAVRVSGPFARPEVALDAQNGRVGFSIGAPADPEACGAVPSEPDKGITKPADLLRRLLR